MNPMAKPLICDFCKEEFEGEPIHRGDNIYCCEACAFEASRSIDCGGRTDIHSAQPSEELDLSGN
jgi:hypothetical protein